MNLTISQPELLKAVTFVNGAAASRNVLPILENTLISVEENKATFTRTDLVTQNVITVPCESDQSGSITVEAKKLTDFAKTADKAKPVALSLGSGEMTIKSGRTRWKLKTLPAAEFLEFGNGSSLSPVSVDSSDLANAITSTSFCMADNDVRHYLNGMHIKSVDGGIDVVATDGHRLAKSFVSCDSCDISIIIAKHSVSQVAAVLQSSSDAELLVDPHFLLVTTEDRKVYTKLIDGRFPDYTRVIPDDSPLSCEVYVGEFIAAVKQVLPVSNDKTKGILAKITPNDIQMSAKNGNGEEGTAESSCVYDGDPLEVGFNAQYMIEALSAVNTETVQIFMTDGSKPMRMNDENNVFVVMPMRV